MFGSPVLEGAIGILFVYVLLSLVCSALSEYLEASLQFRARDLKKSITLLLNDSDGKGVDLAHAFYQHGLIRPLYRSSTTPPSYIPARTFALALWNMVGGSIGGATTDLQKIKGVIHDQVSHTELQEALLTLIDDAKGDFDQARHNIEDWYDSAMDRVSGWYKRRVQVLLLVLGLIVSAALNADSITIMRVLTQDSAVRSAVVTAAEHTLSWPFPTTNPLPQARVAPPESDLAAQAEAARNKLHEIRAQLHELGLPLGWVRAQRNATGHLVNAHDPRSVPSTGIDWLLKGVGILLTGFAISQGAPFWFDVLSKFMVIRSTVKPREKSPAQPSKATPAPATADEQQRNTTAPKG